MERTPVPAECSNESLQKCPSGGAGLYKVSNLLYIGVRYYCTRHVCH